jgi:hypothetical protein
VCAGGQATFAALGALAWPRLAAAYIERRLAGPAAAAAVPAGAAPDAPGSAPQVDAFQSAARDAERFEEAAARTGCALKSPRDTPMRCLLGAPPSCQRHDARPAGARLLPRGAAGMRGKLRKLHRSPTLRLQPTPRAVRGRARAAHVLTRRGGKSELCPARLPWRMA